MSESANQQPLVLAFVNDLMFTSKIDNVIRGLDFRVRWIERAEDVSELAATGPESPGEKLHGQQGQLFEKITAWQPALMVFDLSNADVPWARWIPTLKSSPATRRIPIIAYGSHMNVDVMQEAKRVGADLVLARSRFTADMPELLRTNARVPDHAAVDVACAEPLSELGRSGIVKFNEGAFYPSHDDLEAVSYTHLTLPTN